MSGLIHRLGENIKKAFADVYDEEEG